MLGLRQRAVALGLISLELILVGHMAFERHTVSTSGDVVELHASIDLHGHQERSLCQREATSADDALDTLCHLAPEQLSRSPQSLGPALLELDAPVSSGAQRLIVTRRLWLMAPKASPPVAS